jgi:hypothetical protein
VVRHKHKFRRQRIFNLLNPFSQRLIWASDRVRLRMRTSGRKAQLLSVRQNR